MKIYNLAQDECPYAVYCRGHVPISDFLKEANKTWGPDPAFVDATTRYEYAVISPKKVQLNCHPCNPKGVPVTVSYWEEPMAEQEKEIPNGRKPKNHSNKGNARQGPSKSKRASRNKVKA